MRNNLTNLITAPATAGNLTINARDAFQFPETVVRPAKAIYYIDDVEINGPSISVEYTLNDAWLATDIDLQTLKLFVLKSGLNDYCFDSSDHCGEHVQESCTQQADIFIAENLKFAVKAYLEAARIGQINVN